MIIKRLIRIFWSLALAGLLALVACTAAPSTPAIDPYPIFTQVAATQQALQNQVAQDATTIATLSTPQATPTPMPTPTLQSTDTPQPSSTKTPQPVSSGNNGGVGNPSNAYMTVALFANGVETYEASIQKGVALILRAQVTNTGSVPLFVTANLTPPDGWDVDQNPFSDCPKTDGLTSGNVCTLSWYYTPQVTGSFTLRIYVRAEYTDSFGTSQRITSSPGIILDVH